MTVLGLTWEHPRVHSPAWSRCPQWVVVQWGLLCPPPCTVWVQPSRARSFVDAPSPAHAPIIILPTTATKHSGNGYGRVSWAPVRRKEGKKSQPEKRG